jgi:hypothetical protein
MGNGGLARSLNHPFACGAQLAAWKTAQFLAQRTISDPLIEPTKPCRALLTKMPKDTNDGALEVQQKAIYVQQ